MRVFGYEFRSPVVKAAIGPPTIPRMGPSGAGSVDILPPFGTNPPRGPLAPTAPDYSERFIDSDPRELWYLALPSKLTPQHVVQIMRSALGGDLWQQWQLCSLMLDTWSMLRKCSHEIRQAVAGAEYIVHPYSNPGEDPDDDAKERADLVHRALHGMRPDAFLEEGAFYELVYDMGDAILNGMTMSEVMWEEVKGEFLPRAVGWVHPRHFGYTDGGRIVLFDQTYARLTWALGRQAEQRSPNDWFMANKFILGKYKSRSGSPLGQGLVRPLGWWWSGMVFGRDWMLNFCKRFGSPFLDMTYKPGTPEGEFVEYDRFLAGGAFNGYIRHPEGTKVEVHPQGALGAENPQRAFKEMADKEVQMLFLGQTGTTESTPGKLGGEDAHSQVKRENVQGVARWVGGILTQQLSRAILRLNYGNDDNAPSVQPDFAEEEDPMTQAQRDQIFITAGIPMQAVGFYRRHNMEMPEEGDKVLVGGQIGLMGSTDEEIQSQATLQQQQQPLEEGGSGMPSQPGQEGEEKIPKEEKGMKQLRKAIQKASDKDLGELRELLIRARKTGSKNGELKAVRIKIKHICSADAMRRKVI